jgi:hypothetical protein
MSELRHPMATLGDDELGAELRALASWLDGPPSPVAAGQVDPARRARLRIEAGAGRTRLGWWPFGAGSGLTPALRRSFVLALVALVAVVAIAGAIGFGVPGIRIIFTGASPTPQATPAPATPSLPPTSSPTPTVAPTPPGPLGSDLDLGSLTTPTEAPGLVDFPLAFPTSSSVGLPDTIWFRDGRITLVWKTRPGLPATEEAGIGLLITEFRGSVNSDFFDKMIGPGTTVSPVTVGGVAGWWISGEPHELLYLDPRGLIVPDSSRVVGDSLIWSRGDITFRMETALERGAAIGLAETIR